MKDYLIVFFTTLLIACGGSSGQDKDKEITWDIEPATLSFLSGTETQKISVKSNGDWTVKSDQLWCTPTPNYSYKGTVDINIAVSPNPEETQRSATLTFSSGTYFKNYNVTQEGGEYVLKWQEEFDAPRESGGRPAMPATEKWGFETGDHGWGNNEIQNYIDRFDGTDTCAVVTDGTLKIIAKKKGSEVISIRMNSTESWTYGYFEARLRMPGGKGTWPAFWMLPKDFQNWPLDGEIDIMEYVGYRPNVVQSSIHTQAYNHVKDTEKTATKLIQNAETEFHIYAVEWTADYIRAFVDGEEYFRFDNDKQNDKHTWPFNAPFYLKLNLAWGGDWGGSQGIDESALPATYEIDYVRVYQKE